jgi:hypothetical protein
VDSDVIDHLLTSQLVQLLENKWKYNGTVHQLFTHFKKGYNSYIISILTEFGIPMKL